MPGTSGSTSDRPGTNHQRSLGTRLGISGRPLTRRNRGGQIPGRLGEVAEPIAAATSRLAPLVTVLTPR